MFTVGILNYFPLSINSFARQYRQCFGKMLTFFFSVLCRDVRKSLSLLSERANDITHVKITARLNALCMRSNTLCGIES